MFACCECVSFDDDDDDDVVTVSSLFDTRKRRVALGLQEYIYCILDVSDDDASTMLHPRCCAGKPGHWYIYTV